MHPKNNLIPAVVSLLIGGIVGYFGGPVFVLLVWTLLALGIGTYSNGLRAAIINGAAFGFAVSYVFMVSGYDGSDPLASKLAPFCIFGLFGAMCGAILSLIGFKILSKRIPKA